MALFQYQAFAIPPVQPPSQPPTLGWLRELSVPVLRPGMVTSAGMVAPVSQAKETVSEDKWHQPFSVPVVRIPQTAIGLSVGPVSTSPETTTVDRWHQELSLPVWPLRGLSGFLAPQPIKSISQSAETVSVDRWLQPFSQPVARTISARGNSAFWSGFTPVSSAPAPNGWLQQLSQPSVQARQPQQKSFVIGYNITDVTGGIFAIQDAQTLVAFGSVFGGAVFSVVGGPFISWMD